EFPGARVVPSCGGGGGSVAAQVGWGAKADSRAGTAARGWSRLLHSGEGSGPVGRGFVPRGRGPTRTVASVRDAVVGAVGAGDGRWRGREAKPAAPRPGNFPGVAGYVRALAGMACGPARGGFVDDRSRDEHPVDGHTDVSAVRARVRADPGGGPDGVEARPRWVAGLPELSGAVPGSGRRGGPARGGERWGGGGGGRGGRERGACLAARGARGGLGGRGGGGGRAAGGRRLVRRAALTSNDGTSLAVALTGGTAAARLKAGVRVPGSTWRLVRVPALAYSREGLAAAGLHAFVEG